MGHKREKPVPHSINDYVLMRVYGKRKFYLAQVKPKQLKICRIDVEMNEVVWTEDTKQYTIPSEKNWGNDDVAVINYGLRKNIDIEALSSEHPEMLLRLL